ncbi:carboxymuconolactone decarboxylase family protein [Ramlibacter sp.]|uniref:carboxymuconolactone decarboxylase family protein n=1 Tax=Ramlibacter sp. TaxID=1917967 RepID=UPI002D66BFB6|nr:carboxymuconolactone decarboxylase family protein [Ramlibacter sp.]HYD74560.1 carboxymuconolactone decarboxylase family protein [Ramlibacter sp.]
MDTRIANYPRVIPELFQGLLALSTRLKETSLGKGLIALVDLRVSQINGCAYCVDMHGREFLAADGDLQRLNSVSTWREVPFYSERERAALQWAESLTRMGETHAPREHFDALQPHFSEREIAELTMAVAVINAWNRVAGGLRSPVVRKSLAA